MSEAIGQTAQQPNALLNLKEIATNLGVSYDRLRGFATAPGVKELIGAVSTPGVNGVRYTSESEQLFSMLIAEQNAGLVQPSNAAEFLARTRIERESGQLAHLPIASQNAPNGQMGNFPIDAFAEILARVVQKLQPSPEDRLIRRAEAAELLACHPSNVRKYVTPVQGRRGVYKRSDILRYIASL